jgi:hypothetical protein
MEKDPDELIVEITVRRRGGVGIFSVEARVAKGIFVVDFPAGLDAVDGPTGQILTGFEFTPFTTPGGDPVAS